MSKPLNLAIENDELRRRLKEAEDAIDMAHRVILYRNWNMHSEPSIELDAWNALEGYRRRRQKEDEDRPRTERA